MTGKERKVLCHGSGLFANEATRYEAPKRGTCRRCGREFALTFDGRVRKHNAPPNPPANDAGGRDE